MCIVASDEDNNDNKFADTEARRLSSSKQARSKKSAAQANGQEDDSEIDEDVALAVHLSLKAVASGRTAPRAPTTRTVRHERSARQSTNARSEMTSPESDEEPSDDDDDDDESEHASSGSPHDQVQIRAYLTNRYLPITITADGHRQQLCNIDVDSDVYGKHQC